MKIKLKYKRLNKDAIAPVKGTDHSAGFDLACTDFDAFGEHQVKYYTGIAVEIPKGFVGLLFPRSSVCKTRLRLCNSVGVIDSDYRGEVTAVFDTTGDGGIYHIGDRCCQLVIVPIPKVELEEVTELSTTKRGTGGYGSTGK